jgi:hypothetical protein
MNDTQTSVNPLLEGQEIVDGILIEVPTTEPLPLNTIGSIIRNNLPGIYLVIVDASSPHWSEDGLERTVNEYGVALFPHPSTCFSGSKRFAAQPNDLQEILNCLKEAMHNAISSDSECCELTVAWPTFETLAARITHAVQALS